MPGGCSLENMDPGGGPAIALGAPVGCGNTGLLEALLLVAYLKPPDRPGTEGVIWGAPRNEDSTRGP